MKERRPGSRKRAESERPFSIRWTDRAAADLLAVIDYIAADDPTAAARWLDRLVRAVEDASAHPLSGRRVPELGRDDVREQLRGPYRIVYRVREAAVEVLTVFEGHRLLPEDLSPDEDG